MKIQVLISCMYQKDFSIIEKSNVQSDVIVINQCDEDKIEEFSYTNIYGKECNVIFVNTKERGLSKSRNLALRLSSSDICIICDDDQVFSDGYVDEINRIYSSLCIPDVLIFALQGTGKRYPALTKKIKYLDIFKVRSSQITFLRKSIINNNIYFDEMMGSGTGNGGGEENKFLFQCRSAKLKLFYEPYILAQIKPGASQWFSGYTNNFFQNLGWSTRRTHGAIIGLLYCLYYPLSHYSLYKNQNTLFSVFKNLMIGWHMRR